MARRLPDRISIVHGALVLFALALIGKAGYEQLYRGNYWSAQGKRQHYTSSALPSPRGEILDASGVTLAENRELTRLSIAPREVNDRGALRRGLQRADVDAKWIRLALDTTRRWIDIPTLFPPADIAPLLALRGVYAKATLERVYATSAGLRPIVGRVDLATGNPLDGVERSLHTVLQGDTGRVKLPRDRSGRLLDVPDESEGPKPGNTIVLTINRGLQDICDHALVEAVDSLHASGGDVVVMNPLTGEVLAMASRRITSMANTAVTEPYEPGSTVKPFVAARLIALGKARPDETINTFGGHFELDGRKIEDAEEHEAIMTLSDVIKHSSNVGIVRFAERLTSRQRYELFRDIGFGTPTTIPLPAESPGTLREPVRWSKQSAASLAMGYELTVTPLQIVTAYSAIANGGELLEPHIVKEIRGPDGQVRYQVQRRVIRRAMSPDVAATLRSMLRDVVRGGTSTKAGLATFDVAGKSGTAKRNVGGRYVAGAYTASFVGLFPEEHPQYVILVKLDNPHNGYYGGIVAGSVTNIVLRAALAARDAALDLNTLAAVAHEPAPDTTKKASMPKPIPQRDTLRAEPKVRRDTDSVPPLPIAAPPDTDPRTSATYVVKLPTVPRIAPVADLPKAVPNVVGLPLRAAVRTLHAAGFRVQLIGGVERGVVARTIPSAGTLLSPGRVVKMSGGD